MFSLQNQSAKLTSVNPRAEIHGDEHVMAADLKFEIKVSNDVLSEFDHALKSALYEKGNAAQGELIDEPGHLPSLRFPLMAPIGWGSELPGYETRIHHGIGGNSDISMDDCKVDKFTFEPQDGGTVVVRFRVIAHPGANDLGRLCEMIQQEVEMSLIEPESILP
ncbi:MAG: hypothetical protein A2143_05910 [Gallionellales bacterium RBG_16_57_15]|nr:MAG: hypothetical protein A2143_05910 [Gallionellales bacterium RBG_16_57_15]